MQCAMKWFGIIVSLSVLVACLIGEPVKAITDQGSIDVNGVVPGPPPATAPTILEPENGRTFDEKNIRVAGDCIAGLVVKIFRNNVFAGSAVCQPNNTYELNIDLVEGKNDLLARQYDSLNQSSPDSAITTVYHVPPTSQPNLPGELPGSQPSSGSQVLVPGVARFGLTIDYDLTFQGVFAGKPFNLPLQIDGGIPPYAVSIEWGDGKTSIFSRENNQRFNAEHIYEHGGLYTVKIRVSDRNGNEAFVQFVVTVNGRPGNIVVRSIFHAVQFGGWWVALILISLLFGFIGLLVGFLLARYLFLRKYKKQSRQKDKI